MFFSRYFSLPWQYYSISAVHSSASLYRSNQKDERAKPGSLRRAFRCSWYSSVRTFALTVFPAVGLSVHPGTRSNSKQMPTQFRSIGRGGVPGSLKLSSSRNNEVSIQVVSYFLAVEDPRGGGRRTYSTKSWHVPCSVHTKDSLPAFRLIIIATIN
jgi:hypothetical protein